MDWDLNTGTGGKVMVPSSFHVEGCLQPSKLCKTHTLLVGTADLRGHVSRVGFGAGTSLSFRLPTVRPLPFVVEDEELTIEVEFNPREIGRHYGQVEVYVQRNQVILFDLMGEGVVGESGSR